MTAIILLVAVALLQPPQEVSLHTITAEDGHALPLRYYQPQFRGTPTVVVVHDWGGSLERWTDIAERLRGFGFAVVLFNLRGHGGATRAYYFFTDPQIGEMAGDIALVLRFARERSDGALHILGAGLGANLAIVAAAADGAVDKVVAVSPGLNYRGVTVGERITELPPERLLLIASREDLYSAHSVAELMQLFPASQEGMPAGQPGRRLYDNVGHGVWILKRLPGAVETIARWLSESD